MANFSKEFLEELDKIVSEAVREEAVREAMKQIMKECDHTVGIFYDQSDTDTVVESDLTTDPEKRWDLIYVGDVSYFEYCPICGEKLNMWEKYKDAVEMVQMP